ncbi:MAG: isochorismate synthase [Bdellovibrio bacteriovorus]
MLAPLHLLEQLQARLDETLGCIPWDTGEGMASLALALPGAPVLPPELPGPRFGLIHGRREELRAGYGIAAQWQAAGPNRFPKLGQAARALSPSWHQLDPDETGFHGFALMGFAADPDPPCSSEGPTGQGNDLPNALLWIPELALWRLRDQAAIVLSTRLPASKAVLRRRWMGRLARLAATLSEPLPEPLTPAPLQHLGSLPGLRDWQGLVSSTLGEIEGGAIEKAVLSRRVGLRGLRAFDLRRLQGVLTWLFPPCQVMRITQGDTSFIAATPERLLRVRGRAVEVDAIAGTAPRSASSALDATLTDDLIRSEKDRREHAVVVEALRAALAGCCTDLQVPLQPGVLQLHNAQHLWTPIAARLAGERDLFDLAELLHPTPATNGHPRQAARDWIRRCEPTGRGWYTGAAGILEPDLSGELWVLLRCAEVAGNEARLYAGAGIVAGSDPLNEWRETGHKLSAVATALRFA